MLSAYNKSYLTTCAHKTCSSLCGQDHVHQPLYDVLDYPSFSLTMRVKDIPFMLDTLAAVQLEEIARYRKSLWKVWNPSSAFHTKCMLGS
jgi:hypothetical protein